MPRRLLVWLGAATAVSLLTLWLVIHVGLPRASGLELTLGTDEFRLSDPPPLLLLCALPLLGLGAIGLLNRRRGANRAFAG